MFETLSERLSGVFGTLTRRGVLGDDDIAAALRDVRVALLDADVSLPVARAFIRDVREKARGQHVTRSIAPGHQVVKIVHDELVSVLSGDGADAGQLKIDTPPATILMVGLQGSGKTTTTAKLARRLVDVDGKKVLMASLDTSRPAAMHQLAVLGSQSGIETLPIIRGEDPVQIARRASQHASLGGHDVLLLDTAGRLHADDELMSEAAAVRDATSPREILLVADGLTGQDAVNVAREFDARVGVTGVILTRMDGDGRGGAALSMKAVTGKPIRFIGVGEQVDALEEFHPERIAGRILGMGDIVSLVEKAREAAEQQKIERMARRMRQGRFNMNDLRDQLEQIQGVGGVQGLLAMLPRVAKAKQQLTTAGMDDSYFRHNIALIQSMTRKERLNPSLLKASRKRRIATGAGLDVSELNRLLKLHRFMSDTMKQMGKRGMLKSFLNSQSSAGRSTPDPGSATAEAAMPDLTGGLAGLAGSGGMGALGVLGGNRGSPLSPELMRRLGRKGRKR